MRRSSALDDKLDFIAQLLKERLDSPDARDALYGKPQLADAASEAIDAPPEVPRLLPGRG